MMDASMMDADEPPETREEETPAKRTPGRPPRPSASAKKTRTSPERDAEPLRPLQPAAAHPPPPPPPTILAAAAAAAALPRLRPCPPRSG